jgi:hypothetical protein
MVPRGKAMQFIFTERHLRELCKLNSFLVPTADMVFFGLRGCLPSDHENHDFSAEHAVALTPVDYAHPRCTFGQWCPQDGTIALFPGSTIPHIKYVKISRERNGVGANQLMTGYYQDYRKGVHKAGTSTGHRAFRQTQARPIRRTADDFDFDSDDRVEFDNPYDNLHAAWCMGVDHDAYASAGCQVVVGYPKCAKRGDKPNEGPWKVFHENAYGLQQDSFPYIVLEGRDAHRITQIGSGSLSPRLRFGSQGSLVEKVQNALQREGFYEGRIDGDFGDRTLRAVLAFQTAKFGPDADDGVVGPITASALGVTWPTNTALHYGIRDTGNVTKRSVNSSSSRRSSNSSSHRRKRSR